MDSLTQLIAVMTKEEVRHLKLYLSRIETGSDRKDAQLFDYIRTSGDAYKEEKIHKKLYGKDSSKNAFYRLRGRLQDMICQNLAMLHETKNDKNKLLLYFSVFHVFFDKGSFELAFSYLLKAERLALKAENLEMLDLIYANCIKISSELPAMNPDAYIDKRKKNAEQLNKLREMDQILAAVVYRIKLSQARGREDENTIKLLDEITRKYSADKTLQQSKVFQTKIYRAVTNVLLQRHSYVELERFMVSIYGRFNKAKWFDKSNHDTKLQMLTFLVNSFSRNGKHEKSLSYAEELGKEINQYNKLHYRKFVFYYYNARVINYSATDPGKALDALKELEEVMKGKPDAYYEMFIHLNRGILFFKTSRYNEAIRSFVKYYTNEYYKKSDSLFKLRVAIAELMMQVESRDISSVKIRLEQVRNQFKEEMMQGDAYAEARMYEWMQVLSKNDLQYMDKKLQSQLNHLIADKKVNSAEDNQLLNYKDWLRTKVKR
jgi:tetratricopeptide (TPR) repeat protein